MATTPRKRSSPQSQGIRSQKKIKCNTVEDDDIRCVACPISSDGSIVTPVVSAELKDVLLTRFKEELLAKLNGRWNRSRGSKVEEVRMSAAETIIRSRVVLGINQCTRMLENTLKRTKEKKSDDKSLVPSLLILTRDVRPATICSHIPIYAHILNKVPILILPGKASVEFGSLLGIKSIAAALFLSPSSKISLTQCSDEELDAHNDVDSFINFALQKSRFSQNH